MDEIRIAVRAAPAQASTDVHVQIHVGDVDVTAAGAGLGMDPNALLVPTNRLEATRAPTRVGVARCDCGELGCRSTWATVQRIGDTVRWEWSGAEPMDRPAVFAADQYDREVRRAFGDRRWESPSRTAGRLVQEGVDRDRLRALGLELRPAAGGGSRNPKVFVASLEERGRYQVWVDVPWRGRTPEAVADEVCRIIAAERPEDWPARWHGIRPELRDVPPALAGPGWQRIRV